MRHEQYRHQATEWAHCNDPARALLWQMRTGKSKQIIDNACHLWQALEIRGVLVIAPNGVHRQWIEEELPKHGWAGIGGLSMAWRFANKNNAQIFEIFARGCAAVDGMHWLAINMEALIHPAVKKAINRFMKACGDVMVVYDESHHFGHPKTKRTMLARGIARLATYRRILTGTPVENSPLLAFTQYELLERGALGYETYSSFKAAHAIYEQRRLRNGRQYPALVGYRNLETLRVKMARYSSVVLREDCEDLPPVQIESRFIELSAEQLKWWERVKEQEITFLEKRGQDQGLYGGAAMVKLQQIEGGFWLRPDRSVERVIGLDANPKMLILKDELSQYDEQVIVWFQFIHELEAAHEVLEGKAGQYHGSAPRRDRDLAAFQAGRLRVLLAQPQAGGEGRDLSGKSCGLIIWYSQTPDARLRRQANERATVKGGRSVQIVDAHAPGGVDAHWLSLTIDKSRRAGEIGREGMIEVLKSLNV